MISDQVRRKRHGYWNLEDLPAKNKAARGEGKPEMFDFLGFTFYCSMDTKKKFFRVKVKSRAVRRLQQN